MTLKGKILAVLMAGCIAAALPGMGEARHRHAAESGTQTVVRTEQAHLQEQTEVHGRENRVAGGKGRHAFQQTEEKRMKTHSNTMRMWPVQSKDTGGTLLFSDSPEYVASPGILYQDTVQGEARVLYYHLNNMQTPQKVAVVLESADPSAKATVVKVTRGGISEPSDDYLKVGKATQTMYFSSKKNDLILLMNGKKRLLQSAMNETILWPGQLVYGVYDFTADHPVKVSVIMYPADNDPYEFVDHAPVLPKDEMRLRGTFKGMNRSIYSHKAYDASKDGIVYFSLADDKHDLYRTGIDATDGSEVKDYGNYGILYQISIDTVGDAPVQYYLCPLGGVYAGAMSVRRDHSLKTNLILTPSWATYFGDQTQPESPNVAKAREEGLAIFGPRLELADLGAYDNLVPTYFEFSPPGASNLPVQIIVMPADDK